MGPTRGLSKKGNSAMTKTDGYPYIRAYCKNMGSYDYWIKQQIEEAKADGAPANAVYKPHGQIEEAAVFLARHNRHPKWAETTTEVTHTDWN